MSNTVPRMIGYWHHDFTEEGRRFPSPQDCVQRDWLDANSRATLLQYLQSAPEFVAYRGLSWCRFRCGVDDRTMGYRELWDGLWVWPEGISHYVEHHDVVLPDEFVKRALHCSAPTSLPKVSNPRAVDLKFWLDWTGKYAKSNRHEV